MPCSRGPRRWRGSRRWGTIEASGSPWISSLPENSASAVPSPVGRVEAVVLLGGGAGEWLEPVGVVGGPALERPVLHRLGDRVGQRGVEHLSARQRVLEAAEDVPRKALALDGGTEHVQPEHLIVRDGEVSGSQRAAVGRPLGRENILLTDARHSVFRLLRRGFAESRYCAGSSPARARNGGQAAAWAREVHCAYRGGAPGPRERRSAHPGASGPVRRWTGPCAWLAARPGTPSG